MSRSPPRRQPQPDTTPASNLPRAVFFDRDGVLNVDSGYVFRPEDFVWRETAIASVKWLNDRGVLVFVVTNQSGVSRGFYAEEDVVGLHEHVQRTLRGAGAHVDEFRYCPHHPEGTVEAFRIECACRKPRSGMIEYLIAKWALASESCLLFGDRASDIEAAQGANVRAILVPDDRPLIELVRESFGLEQHPLGQVRAETPSPLRGRRVPSGESV